jgi:acylphosphatase
MCTVDEARRLGVTGWVRNLADGTVEVVAEGESTAVSGLVEWCHHGPPHARVTNATQEYSDAAGLEKTFDIRR